MDEQADERALDKRLRRLEEENARLREEAVRLRKDVARLASGASWDDFLAKLGHELRNPLAPIRSAWEVLRHPGIPMEQAQAAQAVLGRQIAHLSRMVDDLLDVTRMTDGRLAVRRSGVDLAELVREVCEDHRALLATRGLTLEIETGDAPVPVAGDPTRLAQVLWNLLQNAARFTDGGGTVTVRLDVDRRNAMTTLRVRDTGVGIPREALGRLFDPFFQGPQDLARRAGGLGLGLALSRGLVALHGGVVTAESDGPGRGAEFSVTLPLEETVARPVPVKPVPRVRRRRRVLVVEDNPDAADTLRQVLELDGHAVEVAPDAEAGLARARAFRPDVVLSDLGLPGEMDGFAFARAVRRDPALAAIPLVALSGYARAEDARRAREAGFDEHLAKPLPLDALRLMLQELGALRRVPGESCALMKQPA